MRNNIFTALPVIEDPVSRHHYFPTKTFRESRIFKELQKCFCFNAKSFHQWRGPYKLEQFWSFGSREIIFSLLSPSSLKTNFVSHYLPIETVRESRIFKEF